MKQLLLLLLVLTINLLVGQCVPGGPTVVDNGGSEVWGKVVNDSGKAVSGVIVKLYEKNGEKLGEAPVSVDTTNKDGKYSFKDVNNGFYVVQGIDTVSVSRTEFLHRGIEHDTGKEYSKNLQIDTLKHPGKLLVILKNASGKFVGKTGFIPGTPYFSHVDKDTLEILRVAYGKYICKIENPDKYLPVETDSFTIKPDHETVIEVELQIDPRDIPPAPQNLKLIGIIDTVLGKAVLKWDSVKVSDLKTYIVLRGIKEDSLQEIHATTRTIDTVDLVVDTTGKVVINYFQVKAKDNGGNVSPGNDPIPVDAPSPKSVKTQIVESVIIQHQHTKPFLGDTVRVIVSLKNAGRIIESVTWALGKSDSIVKTVRFDGNTHECSDTMIMVWKDSTAKAWYITAYDNSGAKDSIVKKIYGSGMYAPDSWQIFQSPNPKVKQTLTAVSDGKKIFLMGGFFDKISDDPMQPPQMVGSDTITYFTPDSFDGYHYAKMVSRHYYHSSIFYNGKIYSIGGMGSPGSFSTIEMFDPVTNQSVTVDTFPYIRYSASVAVYRNNFIITGGVVIPHPDSTERRITGMIEKYDVSLLEKGGEPLSALGTMFIARKCHSTVMCGSKLIIIGGIDSSGASSAIADIESIDLETNVQAVLPSMKDSRCFFAAVAISDKIYVFGGRGSGTSLKSVETYDTRNPSGWKYVKQMTNARYYMAATVYNNSVYLAGGTKVNSDGKVEIDSTISVYYP